MNIKFSANLIIVTIVFIVISFGSSIAQDKIKEVKIGEQIWTTQNLNVANFSNGDPITEAKTKEAWIKACDKEQPAWCYYEFDAENGEKYGKLYNWYAVNDAKGLAPAGWHIPSNSEWKKLVNHLNDMLGNGNQLKNTTGWEASPQAIGTNSTGFTALPSGVLKYVKGESQTIYDFKYIGRLTSWWTATESPILPFTKLPGAYEFTVSYNHGNASHSGYTAKTVGNAVRCVKD